MPSFTDVYEDFLAFMDLGGAVAWPLLGVTLMMWTLIIDRFWYAWFSHPRARREAIDAWKRRTEHTSWYASQIRVLLISQTMVAYERGLIILRSLVAVCPLLGLLGTVMGMLEVFDVVAISGNGNIRAMASGVSEATVSTMIGMVIALSGLYFQERLRRGASNERRRLEDALPTFEA